MCRVPPGDGPYAAAGPTADGPSPCRDAGADRRALLCDTGRVPARVYNPDHTAHIRAIIRRMAVDGLIGLGVAAVAAGALLALDEDLHGKFGWWVWAVWIAVAVLAGIGLICLAAALVCAVVYRRRRADLDAAGAEAAGELRAKLANQRPGNSTLP
jgi:hypothetical protein